MLDRPTLERLYLEQERPLFNVAVRWTWNAAEAQELVQEAFVRVWAARRRVRRETAGAYVYRTVLNLCQKHARRRDRWRLVRATLLGRPDEGRPRTPEQAGQDAQLREAIERLPDAQRHVLLLTEYTDLKQREIAELLAIPPGTVASRRHTAINTLKESLDAPRTTADADA